MDSEEFYKNLDNPDFVENMFHCVEWDAIPYSKVEHLLQYYPEFLDWCKENIGNGNEYEDWKGETRGIHFIGESKEAEGVVILIGWDVGTSYDDKVLVHLWIFSDYGLGEGDTVWGKYYKLPSLKEFRQGLYDKEELLEVIGFFYINGIWKPK